MGIKAYFSLVCDYICGNPRINMKYNEIQP